MLFGYQLIDLLGESNKKRDHQEEGDKLRDILQEIRARDIL